MVLQAETQGLGAQLGEIFNTVSGWLWGWPLIVLMLGAGIYLTLRTGVIQLRRFGYGWKTLLGQYDKELGDEDTGGILSHFKSLSTALSATIGTGNIVGVATAIILGGPGAPVWMVISAFFGMSTKFVTCTLSNRYREVDDEGNVFGGPMYVIEKALDSKWNWLAYFFAIALAIAAFGIGNMVQANAISERVVTQVDQMGGFFAQIPVDGLSIVIGIALVVLVGAVILGGIRWIGNVAGFLVPIMALAYLVGGIVVLVYQSGEILPSLELMVSEAFSLQAGFGGLVGTAIRYGFERGVFSNEAGLGSAPIAHASARTREPVREGYVAMIGPFIDTIIVCMLTTSVILVTHRGELAGVKEAAGADLTALAFERGLAPILPGGSGEIFVTLALVVFAFTTMLAWSYYGEQAAVFIFGKKAIFPYRGLWLVAIFTGAVVQLSVVWDFAAIFNGLMAVPNIIAALLLAGKVAEWMNRYNSGDFMNITLAQLRDESVSEESPERTAQP